MTDVQQAVPVAQEDREAGYAEAKAMLRDLIEPRRISGTAIRVARDHMMQFARHRLASLPCKSGEGAGEREVVEEAIATSVDDEIARAFIAGWNATREHTDFDMALHYWMLASVTLPDATQTREAEGENGYGCLLEDLHNALHRGEKCPECGHDPYAALNARGGA